MARKTRKQRSTARRPGPRPAVPPAAPRPATGPSAAPAVEPSGGSPRVGGDQAMVRAVEMSLGPATASRRGQRPGALALDTGDAAIPLDRVPYFTSDLVRVGITGVAMIALLVLAALIVIPLLVK